MELEDQIENLRSRIAEHSLVLSELELKQHELRIPPAVPANASPSEVAAIFEAHSNFDDQILGTEAAIAELQRRQTSLQAQLQTCTRELHQRQEQERRDQLTRSVLAEIKN